MLLTFTKVPRKKFNVETRVVTYPTTDKSSFNNITNTEYNNDCKMNIYIVCTSWYHALDGCTAIKLARFRPILYI